MELLIPKDDYIVHVLAILLESTLITKVYYETLVCFSVSSWGIIYVLLHLFIDSITMWTVVWYHPSVCKYTSRHRHSEELTRPHFSGGVLFSLFSYKCTFPLIVEHFCAKFKWPLISHSTIIIIWICYIT